MKKLLLAVLTLALLASPVALAESYAWDSLFTLEYPEGWVWAQTESDGKTIVSFYDEEINDLNVSVEVFPDERLGHITLTDASEEALAQYADYVRSLTPEEDMTWTGRVATDKGGLVFLIFSSENEFGPYLYAESPADGNVVTFLAYAYTDQTFTANRPLDEDDRMTFEQIIRSLTLAR